MGGGDLNMKKSWHPLLRVNQERVWKQEKKAYEERKKLDELRRERDQERQMQELQRLQEEAGGQKKQDKVDWMYATPAASNGPSASELEDYLLGKKRVDQFIDQKTKKANEAVLASSEKKVDTSGNATSAQDLAAKIREDPMFAIKQREQQAYQALLKDPTRLHQMRVAAGLEQPKEDERRKRRRYEDDRRRGDGERRRDRDDERSERRRRDRDDERSERRRRDDRDDDRSERKHRDDRDEDRSERRRREDRDSDRSERRRRDDRDAEYRDHRRRDDKDAEYNDRKRSPPKRRDHEEEYSDRRRHDDRDAGHADRRRDIPSQDTRPSGNPERQERREQDYRREHPAPSNGSRQAYARDTNERRNTSYRPPAQPNRQSDADAEADRAARLARMQSNARDMNADRDALIAKAKEEERLEQIQEDKARQRMERISQNGKASFMLDQQRTNGDADLEDRLKRGRRGLQKMEDES